MEDMRDEGFVEYDPTFFTTIEVIPSRSTTVFRDREPRKNAFEWIFRAMLAMGK